MSVQSWMRADALMSVLLDRGEGSEFAYEAAERVAWLCEGGMSEIAAIESVLGYVPLSERERLTNSDPAPEALPKDHP